MNAPDSLAPFAERLEALRHRMAREGFDAYLVPMADQFQSEYVPDSDQRIRYLSGFTGSSAFMIILKDRAAFFTDSRYTLQAAAQVSALLYDLFDASDKTPIGWLEAIAHEGFRVAYDPWLHTSKGIERYAAALAKKGVSLCAHPNNLVDSIWHDRPPAPTAPVHAYEIGYAGKKSQDKIKDVVETLRAKHQAACVVTDPCSVAWLLNVRGGDVPHTPLPLSRVILYDNGRVEWFIDPRKIDVADLALHLAAEVDIKTADDFLPDLAALGSYVGGIGIDTSDASAAIVEALRAAGAKVENGDDPCVLPRACKNETELNGMRAAHRRDGAALVKFFAWLSQNWHDGKVTERLVEHRLEEFRRASNLYRTPSFDTIAGFGPHGAIVHYRATAATDAVLQANNLLLLDSGGQYLDGTTDVTRTLALGTPSSEMRDRYTRVLKGHIALASVRFPEGTTGGELDVLARQYLWQAGLDFGHGTGHGVGCYLGVHEGPHAISKRSTVPLRPGMVVSNEPGYYKAGDYGIRIENLQTVVEILGLGEATKRYFGFETLTLAPLERNLIDVKMLSDSEKEWINSYHGRVIQLLRPLLDEPTAIWLEAATRPLIG